MSRRFVTIDGNEAASYVAHKTNEVCAIYPITPSSNMGENADEWSALGKTNIWGTIPKVVEMQSEGGASAAVHGSLQSGALTTTFTASQGLLLMIPTMFKVAGELTPTVFHVSARTVATHALSIFGDHSDIMAVRPTGFALLCSGSVQEIGDLALIAQAAALEGRLPMVHFFDGFRNSHEVMKVEQLSDDDLRAMIDDDLVRRHRESALSPDRPVIRGTSQNPDVYFQARETVNPFYNAFPDIVQKQMDKFAGLVGRSYHLFDYVGDPEADRVLIMMGSGAEAAHETVEYLIERGEKVGLVKVRLFRPFDAKRLVAALPQSVKSVAVLDRHKEPGAGGEPLYKDVLSALMEAQAAGELPFAMPTVFGGRYGLSSKEFTPAMVKGVFDNLQADKPKNHFTVGIVDDVTHTSLDYDPTFVAEGDDVVRAMFYGLGSDGTVGANKNSIKIIGEETDNYAQGYFVYDSRKAGTVTISHLRFGPRPIRSSYLINAANFVACHQFVFLEKYDMLKNAVEGATFLLNAPYPTEEVWDRMPRQVQQQIIDKKLKFYVINAHEVAEATGMGQRVNTIMQTCFFAISGILPRDEAIQKIKDAIKKAYGRKGDKIVQMNYAAVDAALDNLHELAVPAEATSTIEMPPPVPLDAPEFVRKVTGEIIAGRGDELPVSSFPVDGTFPSGTTQYEKRNIALEIPAWDPDVCIQCAKCNLVCPHAAIRLKVYDASLLDKAPATFKAADAKGRDYKGMKATIQVAPEDCTGCGLCVHTCPAKNKQEPKLKAINMTFQPPLRATERENYRFFLEQIPDFDRTQLKLDSVKGSQLCRPLLEYSGACSGCGETPYVKLVTQLFGDRAVIGNATGCSSIWGGNLPTTPYAFNADGRGPAWNNSLFEDCAEFTLGLRVAIDEQKKFASHLLQQLSGKLGDQLISDLLNADQSSEADIQAQRERVAALKQKLAEIDSVEAKNLLAVADRLVQQSVWGIGGDGWAYDIGYGGLDHVLASGRNVNLLVLDTEVYSNTGGQMSKATPRGAVAKFAAGGKPVAKKDLGLIAMAYGTVYVAQVAFGASDRQCCRAFVEAESYDGPSLILSYAHCIAHGIDMSRATDNQQRAVDSGHWPLYRYDPRLTAEGKNPLQLDSKAPSLDYQDYAYAETRYQMLTKFAPERAKQLLAEARHDVKAKWSFYSQLAEMDFSAEAEAAE